MALELDGHSKETIDEVFDVMPEMENAVEPDTNSRPHEIKMQDFVNNIK